MNKLYILPVLALSLTAARCDSVNSASAHLCHGAALVGASADIIATDLAAAGIATDKINALIPLIRGGKLLVDVTCAIIVPPTPTTPLPPPQF